MSEEPPPTRRGGLGAASRARSAARRRRGRAIRRRVAGVSLATFLAVSGALVVQMVSGGHPARGATTGMRTAAVVTGQGRHLGEVTSGGRMASAGAQAASHTRGSSRPAPQTSDATAASPSAVTTSAS